MAGREFRDTPAANDLPGRSADRSSDAVRGAVQTVLTAHNRGVAPTTVPDFTADSTRGNLRIRIPATPAQGMMRGEGPRTADVEWLPNTRMVNGSRVTVDPAFTQTGTGVNPAVPASVVQRTTMTGPDNRGAFMRVQGVGPDGKPVGESRYYAATIQNGRYEPTGAAIPQDRIPDNIRAGLNATHDTIGAVGENFTKRALDGSMVVASADTRVHQQPAQQRNRGPAPSGMA